MNDKGADATKAFGGCLLIAMLIAVIVPYVVRLFGGDAWMYVGGVMWLIIILSGIFYIRMRVAQSFYEVMPGNPSGEMRLGGEIVWRPGVRPKKAFRTGTPKAVLRCWEHAINRGGTSDSHYEKDIFKEEILLGEARRVTHGEYLEFSVRFPIPADAPSSFAASNNSVNWQIALIVPVKGLCPDIKQDIALQIEPEIPAGEDRAHAQAAEIPAHWAEAVEPPKARYQQGSVEATLEARGEPRIRELYALPAGGQSRFRLTVRTSSDIHCRNVLCWVGCRVHGSGSEDSVVIMDWHSINEGDFHASHIIDRTLDVRVPASGPVSFNGRYVKIDWVVRVRVDIPIWRDKILELPFLVTPRLLGE